MGLKVGEIYSFPKPKKREGRERQGKNSRRAWEGS